LFGGVKVAPPSKRNNVSGTKKRMPWVHPFLGKIAR